MKIVRGFVPIDRRTVPKHLRRLTEWRLRALFDLFKRRY